MEKNFHFSDYINFSKLVKYQGKGVRNNPEKIACTENKKKQYKCKLRITVNVCLLIKPAPVLLNIMKGFFSIFSESFSSVV